MRQMFDECHTVVDRWKPFMTESSHEENSDLQRSCLKFMLHKFAVLDLPDHCYCPLSCVQRTFEISFSEKTVGILDIGSGYSHIGIIELIFNRWHKHLIITDVPAYTGYDLLSDISGIVGMFVGMSSLSILEIIICICLMCLAKLRLKRK